MINEGVLSSGWKTLSNSPLSLTPRTDATNLCFVSLRGEAREEEGTLNLAREVEVVVSDVLMR